MKPNCRLSGRASPSTHPSVRQAEEVQVELKTAAAFYTLGLLTSEELVEIGTEALGHGVDTPAIRTLAGLADSEISEARLLFEQVVRDSGEDGLVLEQAALIAGSFVARRIVAREVSPRSGAKEIEAIYSASNYATELGSIGLLYDEYAWDEPRSSEEIDRDVLKEAQLLVERSRI